MPYGDRTGPEGRGSRTGRGLGYCSGNNAPGFASRGRGWRFRGFPQTPARTVELTDQEQAKILEAEKTEISKRLKAIGDKLKELKK